MLIGRERECERVDELLDRARLGRSGALLIRGEAGIGKTALLDYAAARAEGMQVVRTLGVESEAELEFSGLLDVCRPLLDHLAGVSERQADALRSALNLGPAVAVDRFAIGAATLSLFALAAEEMPLLVVVDDAQWVDPSSSDALLFATRRLVADRVAVLYAVRADDERDFAAPGIDVLELEGLSLDAATAILRERVDVSPVMAARLHAATGGNPLALVEAPTILTSDQLLAEALAEPLPAGSRSERVFARRTDALPEDARRALLVAAASATGGLQILVAALESLGLESTALEAAEDAGLVTLRAGKVTFRHPLVRSAVYHAAAPSERRAVHRALATSLAGRSQDDERAWHLAAAALGSDDEAASALVMTAARARARNAHATAASALHRAATLTPGPELRLERLGQAADDAWRAGRVEAASALIAEVLASGNDARGRAGALKLHGAIEYVRGNAEGAAPALLEAFSLLRDESPEEAVAVAADAVNALVRAGRPERALEVARGAQTIAVRDADAAFDATLALGFALRLAGRYDEAEADLRRAVGLLRGRSTTPRPLQTARIASALDWLGLYEDGSTYFAEAATLARARGAVGELPSLLAVGSWQELHAGRWNEAHADAGEALELALQLAQPVAELQALGVLTWLHALRGDDARCTSYASATSARVADYRVPHYEHLVHVSLGLLALGTGRIEEAIGRLEAADAYGAPPTIYVPGAAAPYELAEAYARAGRLSEAADKLESIAHTDLPAGALLSALRARCLGLLAEPDGVDELFEEALEHHAALQSPFPLARTRLCYGERLRRAGRRVDARAQLNAALEIFERLGAAVWAERARSELRSSGQKLRRRDDARTEELTPQELQIALQVAEGKTNKEVGAALFLSHKTVEFHLSRIYRKLDLNSRAELIRLFAESGAPVELVT